MTTHPILPSRNEDYGFFRALDCLSPLATAASADV